MPLILNFTMPPLNLGDSLGHGVVMNQDQGCADGVIPAANDNGDGVKTVRIDEAVLRIARLIGRQMAREQFEHASPANDNESTEKEIPT
jgi:hypothetical protein